MSTPSDPTQFTRESAERIARVVRAAELAVPVSRALTFDRIDSQRKEKVFRVCTFTGAWSIGSSKTVTFCNVTSTPNTVSAVNLFFPISAAPPSAANCAVAKDGSQWYLVDVPFVEATAVFVGQTQSVTYVTGTSAGTTIAGVETRNYVTDVAISASLNTSSCTITVGKTLTTAAASFVTGTASAVFASGTATASVVAGTYTAAYIKAWR
jgi:hypothetical protein